MSLRLRRTRLLVDAATAAICGIGAWMTFADAHSPIRSGLILAALVAGTGWAATCWIEFDEAAFAGCVVLGTGASLVCFYALFFVEIGWWHPIGSVGALLIAAGAVNAIAGVRDALRRTTS